ncbi:MAG: 1-deoxy-D-xylulose-5-phosphate reductoisomerase, partial [Hyphomicrobiaceae bacterium]|nr:1-deoxy-D-xylulose-5-phosphate reductoisomerase [Hyphomicrobiaceae bacterium]
EKLDLAKIASLSFEPPDENRFPALKLARQSMMAGGNATTIMNAANEIAVEAFLNGALPFMEIAGFCERNIEAVQHKLGDKSPASVAEVLEIDHITRKMAQSVLMV